MTARNDDNYETPALILSALEEVGREMNVPGLKRRQTFLGPEWPGSPESWVTELVDRRAPFDWISFSFGELPMWQLHVGVILFGGQATYGLHVAGKAPTEFFVAVKSVGESIGELSYSEVADEHQFNMPLLPYGDSIPAKQIAEWLSETYVAASEQLRRRSLI